MKRSTQLIVAGCFVALTSVTRQLDAQLYSEIPGIVSASVPYAGRVQRRFDVDLSYHRQVALTDGKWGAEARFAYGRSYRVFTNWEVGADFTAVDAAYVRRENPNSATTQTTDGVFAGHAAFGLRVGAKYRLFSYLSPSRTGAEASVFATFRPNLKTGISVIQDGDSVWSGGLFKSSDDDQAVFEVPAAASYGLAVGYRSRKVTIDATLQFDDSRRANNPVLPAAEGFHPQLGVIYRATESFAAGVTAWGESAPPWEMTQLPGIGRVKQSYAVVLTFGRQPGGGTDIVIGPDPEAFEKAFRLFIRSRKSF